MNIKISINDFVAALIFSAVSIGAQQTAPGHKIAATSTPSSFGRISRAEVELLLADAAVSNPDVLKRLDADPAMRKSQLENLRQLFGFASEAERSGLATEPANKQELQNIRSEITAFNYDRQFNKDQKTPFASIGRDQITQFWSMDMGRREAEFKTFFDTKLKLLNLDHPVTDEEKAQAREFYAKIQISEKNYGDKMAAGALPKPFQDKVALQIKLQQAQFLAKAISDKLASQTAVSDQDVAAYVSAHPEFDIESRRAKAEKLLQRAKAGEDFAMLADQFSDDPGNRGEDGKLNGGLYANVSKGRMIPAFEQAALSLKMGDVADQLVQTEYGYHIIKLEKALGSAGTFDVRHILVSTDYADPADPAARHPLRTFVRSKLKSEKETRLTNEIVARNHISVPDDFTVPPAAASTAVIYTAPAAKKKTAPVKKRLPAARRSRKRT